MPIEKLFVIAKIDRIKEYMEKARIILKISDYDIVHSNTDLAALERYFQLIVDYVIDINHHFIKEGGLAVPNDLQSTFTSLADNSIIPKEFAAKIAPSVGLRNRIVHQYEDIDPEFFVKNVRNNLADYDEYIRFILKALKV